MAIEFPALPYEFDDLEPYISRDTLTTHYGKHHKNYVMTLNKLISGTTYDSMSLEDIVRVSKEESRDIKIYNNSAQAWNHQFYWDCLSVTDNGHPSDILSGEIQKTFGSLEKFKDLFKQKSTELFGSGWSWLVKNAEMKLEIVTYGNAENPLTRECVPLLCCDVWEHAYYLDYKNERDKYFDNFWKVVNWDFVETGFEAGAHPRFRAKKRLTPEAESMSH